MKALFTTVLLAAAPLLAGAQATAPAKPAAPPAPAAKPAARPATTQPNAPKAVARPVAKTTPAAAARKPTDAELRAIEEATPLEEPDPTIKLSEAELEIARKIFVGEIKCELGASVRVRALQREGFFLVSRGINRFVMHPVESRTGAIRLEDPVRGGLWLQLGNKSMLMNQKEGKRLADECQSPEQATFAQDMKNKPAVNLLEAPPSSTPAKTGPN